jgi:hypothetical protein
MKQVAVYKFKIVTVGLVSDLGYGYNIVTDGLSPLRMQISESRTVSFDLSPGQPPVDTSVAPILMFSYRLINGAYLQCLKSYDEEVEEN